MNSKTSTSAPTAHPPHAGAAGTFSVAIPHAVRDCRRRAARCCGVCAGDRAGTEDRRRSRICRRRWRRTRSRAVRRARDHRRDVDRDLRALLQRFVDRRARHRRSAQAGVRSPADVVARLLRGHAHGRSDLAAHQRYNHAGVGNRLQPVDGAAQHRAWRGGADPADADQPQADAAGARGPPGRAAADHPVRPPRAAPGAREPGSRCRHRRLCRRGDPRDPHRASLRARTGRSGGLRAARRACLRGRRSTHSAARTVDRRGDFPGVRRGRHHSVDRRPRRACRSAFRRTTVGLRVLRRGRRDVGRRGERSCRRTPARRGRDRAPVRDPRHAAGDRRAGDTRAASRAAARHRRARNGDLRLSVPPRRSGLAFADAQGRGRRARRAGGSFWRGQDHGVPVTAALLRSAVRTRADRRRRRARRRSARRSAAGSRSCRRSR